MSKYHSDCTSSIWKPATHIFTGLGGHAPRPHTLCAYTRFGPRPMIEDIYPANHLWYFLQVRSRIYWSDIWTGVFCIFPPKQLTRLNKIVVRIFFISQIISVTTPLIPGSPDKWASGLPCQIWYIVELFSHVSKFEIYYKLVGRRCWIFVNNELFRLLMFLLQRLEIHNLTSVPVFITLKHCRMFSYRFQTGALGLVVKIL